jgi:hypothetical protein
VIPVEGQLPIRTETDLSQVEKFFDPPPERVTSNPHSQIAPNLVVGAIMTALDKPSRW